ncbi:MAG: hypothetical protein JRJ73_04120 [Deltaproteobacteria bacterium]|nr:hypothetical protein [Deltaproteobacteria bacterium]
MPRDTFVTIDDIPVMYVAGEKGRPIPEQAPEAFRELEAKLPSLKGRKFYGVEFAGEYRACAAILAASPCMGHSRRKICQEKD